MDLGGWPRSLGFEKVEAMFRENATDGSVLGNLTEKESKANLVRQLGRATLINSPDWCLEVASRLGFQVPSDQESVLRNIN